MKENDLAHGEFMNWVRKIGMSQASANKFMKIANDPQLNSSPAKNLGVTVLYEIATLPEEERNKEYITSSGEVKTPDEMTRKELRELKKQIKQEQEEKAHLESRLEQAQRSESIARKQLEEYISIHNIYRRSINVTEKTIITTKSLSYQRCTRTKKCD